VRFVVASASFVVDQERGRQECCAWEEETQKTIRVAPKGSQGSALYELVLGMRQGLRVWNVAQAS